jgi:acyl carrier protein
MSFLEDEFNCKVLPEEMVIENFMTVSHMMEYLKGKQ